MSRFDFSRLFGNNSSADPKHSRKRRGRKCRIEELESRDMLAAHDDGGYHTIQTEPEYTNYDEVAAFIYSTGSHQTTYTAPVVDVNVIKEGTSLQVSWNDIQGAAAYRIEYTVGAGFEPECTVKSTIINASSLYYEFDLAVLFKITDKKLESGEYHIRVTAIFEETATNADINIRNEGASKIATITWQEVSDASGYTVWVTWDGGKESFYTNTNSYTIVEGSGFTFSDETEYTVTVIAHDVPHPPADITIEANVQFVEEKTQNKTPNDGTQILEETASTKSHTLIWKAPALDENIITTGYEIEIIVNDELIKTFVVSAMDGDEPRLSYTLTEKDGFVYLAGAEYRFEVNALTGMKTIGNTVDATISDNQENVYYCATSIDASFQLHWKGHSELANELDGATISYYTITWEADNVFRSSGTVKDTFSAEVTSGIITNNNIGGNDNTFISLRTYTFKVTAHTTKIEPQGKQSVTLLSGENLLTNTATENHTLTLTPPVLNDNQTHLGYAIIITQNSEPVAEFIETDLNAEQYVITFNFELDTEYQFTVYALIEETHTYQNNTANCTDIEPSYAAVQWAATESATGYRITLSWEGGSEVFHVDDPNATSLTITESETFSFGKFEYTVLVEAMDVPQNPGDIGATDIENGNLLKKDVESGTKTATIDWDKAEGVDSYDVIISWNDGIADKTATFRVNATGASNESYTIIDRETYDADGVLFEFGEFDYTVTVNFIVEQTSDSISETILPTSQDDTNPEDYITEIADITANSITVRWNSSIVQVGVDGYRVEWSKSAFFFGQVWTSGNLKECITEYTLPNLDADEIYYIRIIGNDTIYLDSAMTAQLGAKSEEEQQSALGIQVAVHDTISTNLVVSWNKTDTASLYFITYTWGEGECTSITVSAANYQDEGSTMTATLIGLLPETLYSVTISALGKPGFADIVSATISESTGTTLTQDQVAEQNDAVKVTVRIANGKASNAHTMPVNAGTGPYYGTTHDSVTLTWAAVNNKGNLTNAGKYNESYEIGVQSNWAVPKGFKINGEVLVASNLTGSLLKEAQANARIALQEHFNVPGNLIWHKDSEGRIIGVTIKGLESGQQYRLTVTALNAAGERTAKGKTTSTTNIIVRTLTPAQAQIRAAVYNAAKTIDSVQLRWGIPTSGIDGYQIEVRGQAHWFNPAGNGKINNLSNQLLATITIATDVHGNVYIAHVEVHDLGIHEVKSGAAQGAYQNINPLIGNMTELQADNGQVFSVFGHGTEAARIIGEQSGITGNNILGSGIKATVNVFFNIGGLMSGKTYTFNIFTLNGEERFKDAQGKAISTRISAATLRYVGPSASVKNTGTGTSIVRGTHIEIITPKPPQIPTKVVDGVRMPNDSNQNLKHLESANASFWNANTNFVIEIYAAGTTVANQTSENNLLLLNEDEKRTVKGIEYGKVDLPNSITLWGYDNVIEGSPYGSGTNFNEVQQQNTAAKTSIAPVLEQGKAYIVVIRAINSDGQRSEIRRVNVGANHNMY